MKYSDSYPFLKRVVNYIDDLIVIDDKTLVRNFDFESQSSAILPGGSPSAVKEGDFNTEDRYCFVNKTAPLSDLGILSDYEIKENSRFRYHLMMPSGTKKADQVILLLHGLNEKDWNKYLPWGKRILETTGKAVLFFPIAFHMNRAPAVWSDAREMYKLSSLRKAIFPDMACSSLSNVAISSRVHAKPQRFIWSGLQTYYDIIQLLEQIKRGEHPAIAKETNFDVFAYSIGAFLSQILVVTNYKNYFEHSKLAMFCGGAVFNRLSPVSKFILDSEANVSLYSFLIEHLENQLKRDKFLNYYLNEAHPEGHFLRCMLNYRLMYEEREAAFRKIANRLMAVVLEKDAVVPPYEVVNSLKGRKRDIPISIEELDFPYPYTHEDPFPLRCKNRQALDESFDNVFDVLCDFLSASS